MIATSVMVQLGVMVTWVAGFMAALVLIAKSPLGRGAVWIYTRLFGEPIGIFFRRNVAQVVDEKLLKRNHGSTIPDLRVELGGKIDALSARTAREHHDNTSRLDGFEVRFASIEQHIKSTVSGQTPIVPPKET